MPDDPAIERFAIPGEDGYSEFWRRDKSPIEPIELAKLLLAVRKVTAFVGRNVGEVVWSGMDVEHAIALDPSPIMGRYPVPAAKTDLIVGLAVGQAYKRSEWSERVRELALARLSPPPQYEYKLKLFLSLAEDVYADLLANRSVLGRYSEVARRWRVEENARKLLSPPTLSELLHLWWVFAADRDADACRRCRLDPWLEDLVDRAAFAQYYRRPLEILADLVPALRDEAPRIAGIAERTGFRVERYAATWNALLPFVKFWIGDSGDRFMVPDADHALAVDEDAQQAVKATIVGYAKQIERALPKKDRDYTALVADNVMNAEGVVPVAGNDVLMPATDKVDKALRLQLERVVRRVAERSNSYNRGLTSGKIHSRRLYRAQTTGTVFQQKKHEFDLRHEIVLLVDATGSMADPAKWNQAEVIYQTLFAAIHAYARSARIFAYNEVKDSCRISELYRGGRMHTVLPHGKTASGEAIVATALMRHNRQRRCLIVHLTDGASNWGCGVAEAIAACRRLGVGVVTLGIGCSLAAKQSLRAEYGELVQFIDRTEQLPPLVGALLRDELRHSAGARR